MAAGGTAATQAVDSTANTETLLRTRGNLTCWLDGSLSAAISVRVAVGLLLVPGGSATTVLSSPITDADASWLWYTTFTLGFEVYIAGAFNARVTEHMEVIDSKAMRIIRPDVEIQLVAETVAVIGAGAPVNIAFDGRMLFGT